MPELALFGCIDNQGDPSLSEDEKLVYLASGNDMLKHLDVDDQLIKEIETLAHRLRPLSALVLGRHVADEEAVDLEGRGAFFEHIPVEGPDT